MPRQERRAQLLDAARAVFVAKGYFAASVEDIAEQAGVTKPIVYQHFPGKLELYVALIDESAARLVSAVEGALESTTDNQTRVEATVSAYFRYVESDDAAFRLVFESDLVHEPAVRERVLRAQHECAALIADVIAEDAGLSTDQAMLLAVALTGMAQVSARWWLQTDGDVSLEAATGLLAHLSWRGISGFPHTAGEVGPPGPLA